MPPGLSPPSVVEPHHGAGLSTQCALHRLANSGVEDSWLTADSRPLAGSEEPDDLVSRASGESKLPGIAESLRSACIPRPTRPTSVAFRDSREFSARCNSASKPATVAENACAVHEPPPGQAIPLLSRTSPIEHADGKVAATTETITRIATESSRMRVRSLMGPPSAVAGRSLLPLVQGRPSPKLATSLTLPRAVSGAVLREFGGADRGRPSATPYSCPRATSI